MVKVSIVVAVYNPNLIWFEKQLESINNQSYTNIEVLVCDDCSSSIGFSAINEIINNKIYNFPVRIYQNVSNIGCTKTFNDLVLKADGDYISFCDQDDIWEPEKISELVKALEKNNSLLAYCKASVIDENDNLIISDWNKFRKHANIGKENKIFNSLLFRTWIAGCFMLVRADIIKKAYPFCEYTIYDHWVALITSLESEFIYVNKSLIQYRRHSNTQTGSFMKVNSKLDYRARYIDSNYNFIKEARKRISNIKADKNLDDAIKWCKARVDWWNRFSLLSLFNLFKGLKFDKKIVVFELLAARMPERLFNRLVNHIQEGKI